MEAFKQYRILKQAAGNSESDIGSRDVSDPRQWSTVRKFFYTAIIWALVFVTGWASAVDATAHEPSAQQFHVSEVKESVATSIFLFGIAFGALIAGPCSETIGRLSTYLTTFVIFMIFTMASALAPNFRDQVVFRGIAGLSAAPSMSIYGGSLADLFDTKTRSTIWPVFALSPLLGPIVAPIAGGWITQNMGWSWDDWITLIIAMPPFLSALIFLPETYGPLLLKWKSSSQTQNSSDEDDGPASKENSSSLWDELVSNLGRIVFFITRELTTVLFGLYLTFLYLMVFGFLEGFDFIFSDTYRFDIGQRYTSFTAVAVGVLIAVPYVYVVPYLVAVCTQKPAGNPEARLVPSLLAAPMLPISLFWIGWTDQSNVSYYSVLGGCCLFGFSSMVLFTTTYHYLLDSYGTSASSALSAITFMRYLASGGMVIATEPLYQALTVKWTLTLLGSIAAGLAPIPWIFWWFGGRIRKRSRYAKHDEAAE
jgi:MFS transporter, DHA1 family, multidrug resistance protein